MTQTRPTPSPGQPDLFFTKAPQLLFMRGKIEKIECAKLTDDNNINNEIYNPRPTDFNYDPIYNDAPNHVILTFHLHVSNHNELMQAKRFICKLCSQLQDQHYLSIIPVGHQMKININNEVMIEPSYCFFSVYAPEGRTHTVKALMRANEQHVDHIIEYMRSINILSVDCKIKQPTKTISMIGSSS